MEKIKILKLFMCISILLSIIVLVSIILLAGVLERITGKIGDGKEIDKQKALFDVSISLMPEFGEVEAGKDLIVTTKIMNMGLEDVEDIVVKYSVWDKERKNGISTASETVAIQTSIALVRYIKIPESLPYGNYIIDVEVEYDGEKAGASSSFLVKGRYIISEKQILMIILSALLIVLIIITIMLYCLIKIIKQKKGIKRGSR